MFDPVLSDAQKYALASLVYVGDSAYRELVDSQPSAFEHPYFKDTLSRIRTKMVQIQCELESHDPMFPFDFAQREFAYRQFIPELRTTNMIIHIARSSSPHLLSYRSRYKEDLSHNNKRIHRQLVIDERFRPPFSWNPFYGLLVFGGKTEPSTVLQFPAPGYDGIADLIELPQIIGDNKKEETEGFERKKAILKKEFLSRRESEVS